MTTIQLKDETLQRIRLKKIHYNLVSYDQVVNKLLDEAAAAKAPKGKVRRGSHSFQQTP